MDRRTFFKTGLAAGAAAVSLSQSQAQDTPTPKNGKFKLRYAPQFNTFDKIVGGNPKDEPKFLIDQLKFMADQGFTAMQDNGMSDRPVKVQEAVARELDRLGMTMGAFIMHSDFSTPTYVSRDADARRQMVKYVQEGVECAKRMNGKWMLLVPGLIDTKTDWDYQTANLVENLKAMAGEAEKSGMIIVIEPLNKINHPGLFLTKISQAYQICKAVGSPSCKILNDLYHQQITEGNLIHNINAAWEEIAYIHLGDVPGRAEPTTGEINYRNIFKHLYEKKYQGLLGLEHGASKGKTREGQRAVLEAYRQCDNFS